MTIELQPAQIWKFNDKTSLWCCEKDYFILLSRDYTKDLKMELWKIGTFWFSGQGNAKNRRWGGARQKELTESDIRDHAKFIAFLGDFIK